MGLEAGVPDALDFCVALEEARDILRVLVVPLHAQREGLQPAQDQPALVGVRDAAHRSAELAHGGDLLGAADERPRHQVLVAVQVLGDRVQDHAHAVLRGALVEGGRERAVEQQVDPVLGRDLHQPRNVGDAQVRVGRRLADQHPGLRPDRGLELRIVAGAHEAELDAELPQHVLAEATRVAVAVLGQHDVGAGANARE